MSKIFKIALLPGDGIGLDVTSEAVKALRAVEPLLKDIRFEMTEYAVSAAEYLANRNPLPEVAIDACC